LEALGGSGLLADELKMENGKLFVNIYFILHQDLTKKYIDFPSLFFGVLLTGFS